MTLPHAKLAKDAKETQHHTGRKFWFQTSLRFSVVEEAWFARLYRILRGVFDLLCSQPQFQIFLNPTPFAGRGRCTSFAPIIFDGDKQQRRAPQHGQQKYE